MIGFSLRPHAHGTTLGLNRPFTEQKYPHSHPKETEIFQKFRIRDDSTSTPLSGLSADTAFIRCEVLILKNLFWHTVGTYGSSTKTETMERRDFLLGVTALSLGLTGCVAHPDVVLDLEEVSDSELADRASNDAEIIEREVEKPNVTSELFENGTYTRTARWEAINTDLRYVYDGEYYRVDVETSPAPPDVVYEIDAEYVGDEGMEDELEYEELPEVDREALSFLTSAEVTDGEYQNSTEYLYEAGADEESAIASEATVVIVVVDGRRFSVETEESNDIERQDYEYTSEKIASSQDEFVSWLKDEYRFELSGLSEEERAVVEEAIEEGYYENSSEEAFESLVNRFQEHDAIEPEQDGGNWIVEYENTTYWADLRY